MFNNSQFKIILNSEFVKKNDIPFNSFIIKAEEKEEFLCKMDRFLIEIKKLINFKVEDITPFNYQELPEEIVEKYVSINN